MRYAASHPATADERSRHSTRPIATAALPRASSAAITARPVFPWPPRTAITRRTGAARRRRQWHRRGSRGCPRRAAPGRRARARLSAARARLPPRLTRLTPEREQGGRVGDAGQPGHHVERRRDRRGDDAGWSISATTPGTKTQSAPASTYRTARATVSSNTSPVAPPNQVSVRAFRTKVPGGCRGAGGRDPLGGLVDPEQGPTLPGSSRLPPTTPSPRPPDGQSSPTGCRRTRPPGRRSPARRPQPRSGPRARAWCPGRATPPSGTPQRPGDAGARRGDRREADLLEDPRGPGVPRVGQHEARTVVQGQEIFDCHRTSTSACDGPPDSRA